MKRLLLLSYIIILLTSECGNKVDPSALFPISYNSFNESDFDKSKEESDSKKKVSK